VGYGLCSSLLAVVNKYAITYFPFPGLLTALRNATSVLGMWDLEFVRGARTGKSEAKFVYLLGADDLTPADIPEDAFVVYQGHHGNRSAYRANVILPGAAFVFYLAIFTNLPKHANVDTFIVFRSSNPLLVALADLLFRGQALPSVSTFESLLVILAGVVGQGKAGTVLRVKSRARHLATV
jgi:hypothetical protein